MENIFYGLIVILLLANLYFVTRKETEEDNKDDEYLIKGIVSEIIENEESQIYKLLNRSDQTVKDFLEKTGEIKSSITGVDQQTRNLISVFLIPKSSNIGLSSSCWKLFLSCIFKRGFNSPETCSCFIRAL